jgi:glycosyltransferase involved in cell wall biosynthesis
MESDRLPLVSIGVPVFNGASTLARSLDSLLDQDYQNLEIIISDNGSTDDTPHICERYARRDPRIRFHRAERNMGSPWNFNRVFDLSSGKYFMWAAHDDERESSFVSACVERLEQSPEAVLCQAHTVILVEGQDQPLCLCRLDTFETATSLVDRYRESLKRVPATAIYGLFRSSAMRQTKRFQRVIGSDLAFVEELSIHGPFVQVPRTLFRYWGRAKWNTIDEDARGWLSVSRKPWWYVPFVMVSLNRYSRLLHAPISPAMKVRLSMVLASHQAGQVVFRVILKLGGVFCPAPMKERLARAIYRRWLHNPNFDMTCTDAYFLERVCKPQVGWWK